MTIYIFLTLLLTLGFTASLTKRKVINLPLAVALGAFEGARPCWIPACMVCPLPSKINNTTVTKEIETTVANNLFELSPVL